MIVAYWVRGEKFTDLARISAKSVERVYPEADIVFVEDTSTRPMMVANLDAQIQVLASAERGSRVLFLDADALLCQEFPWDSQHDLWVTWRDHVNGDRAAAHAQPYNYGVLGCVANERTTEAFYWLRARILGMAKKYQDWYGNQLALADLLGQPSSPTLTPRIRWSLSDTGTPLKVCCLPCETWNWSPDKDDEDIADKGVIHLKGNRKDLVDHYAARLAA